MEKQIVDILNKWAQFSDYDKNRNSFTIGNITYEFHQIGQTVSNIIEEEFDPSGITSLIYIRKSFDNVAKNSRVRLYDLITRQYDDAIEMYDTLHQPELEEYENIFIDKVSELITQITGLQIGERDLEKEKDVVVSCLTDVVENLRKLNVYCFQKSNESIGKIQRFSTKCEIASTLAGCVLEVESTHPDGIFLYYIEDDNQLGGYFTFIIKSNGNILSINDKANEAYVGQHNYSRNGRWAEAKQYDIFPYVMADWEGSDYKGYPLKQRINEDRLQLKNVSPSNYISIIVAMMFLCNKYQDKMIDMDLTYSSMMLNCNTNANSKISENTKNEIVIYKDSQIAEYHRNYEVSFKTDDVIAGRGCTRKGKQDNLRRSNQKMVDIWGKGFEIDTTTLNKHHIYPKLGVECNEFESEAIGSYESIQMQSYMDACSQLADYMRKNMYFAYEKFIEENGSIKEWYKDKVHSSIENIYKICVERYFYNKHDDFINFDTDESHRYISGSIVLNEDNGARWHKEYRDPVTDNLAYIMFEIVPKTEEDIKTVLGGIELPDILKCYNRNGHGSCLNVLLDMYDPVDMVGNIFENKESRNYLIINKGRKCDNWGYLEDRTGNPEYNFSVGIGFSKRGLNQLKKLYDSNDASL